MKSLMSLQKVVLEDLGTICGVDTTKDFDTILGRFEDEGDAFLGITLADFGKAFERALELGQWDVALCTSFRTQRGLPVFLQGFLRLVFDEESGALLQDPNVSAIWAVRQITLMWAKMASECSDERNRKAIRSYLECENDVKNWTRSYRYDTARRSDFRRMSVLLFGDLFDSLERDIRDGCLIPRHGPGATANAVHGNSKWSLPVWSRRLEKVFPMVDYLLPSYRHWEMLADVDIIEPGSEPPVKVVLVPKTMKTPRIIAMEPSWVMYAQQGIQRRWYELVDDGKVLSSAFHNFEDQSVNNWLAREGSEDKSLATLDLSEASDRVSMTLVADLLHHHPYLKEAVFACRSTSASVQTPSTSQSPAKDSTVRLWKFASMGSALCFPVESACFLAAVFVGIQQSQARPLTRRSLKAFQGRVQVYGDDIIVPSQTATPVQESLEAYGFKVNTSKSFRTGNFRESCGGDYYAGHDVSIVKLRSRLPMNRRDTHEIVSLTAFRNMAYLSLMWKTAQHCDGLLERVLRHFPAVADSSPAIGRTSFLGYDNEWEHPDLHSPRVKGWVARAPLPVNRLDGIHALRKIFHTRGVEPFSVDHLERSGRPQSVKLTLRGTQPF